MESIPILIDSFTDIGSLRVIEISDISLGILHIRNGLCGRGLNYKCLNIFHFSLIMVMIWGLMVPLVYLILPYIALGTQFKMIKSVIIVIMFLGNDITIMMWYLKLRCTLVREVLGLVTSGITPVKVPIYWGSPRWTVSIGVETIYQWLIIWWGVFN